MGFQLASVHSIEVLPITAPETVFSRAACRPPVSTDCVSPQRPFRCWNAVPLSTPSTARPSAPPRGCGQWFVHTRHAATSLWIVGPVSTCLFSCQADLAGELAFQLLRELGLGHERHHGGADHVLALAAEARHPLQRERASVAQVVMPTIRGPLRAAVRASPRADFAGRFCAAVQVGDRRLCLFVLVDRHFQRITARIHFLVGGVVFHHHAVPLHRCGQHRLLAFLPRAHQSLSIDKRKNITLEMMNAPRATSSSRHEKFIAINLPVPPSTINRRPTTMKYTTQVRTITAIAPAFLSKSAAITAPLPASATCA